MDVALKQVQKVILAAVPAYETYFLQLMGKPFLLKPPLFKVTPELLRITFDSVEEAHGANRSPERLVMYAEYNRAMESVTVRTEYWQDIDEEEPTARGEAKVDATSENLMAPAFAFGWLHKLVAPKGEGAEGDDMSQNTVEARMERAEKLIVKTDEILGELGYVIEADSYESFANTLDNFLMMSPLEEQVEGILGKVGHVVRKAASAYGAAKGGAQGLKARWHDFKASVKGAYHSSHKKAFDKFSGRKSSEKGAGAAKGADHKPGKPSLKIVKGGKKGGERHPGGKMKDTEYKKRYPHKARKMASSLDTPSNDLAELMNGMRNDFFEREFHSLDVDGLLALEELMTLEEGGEKFKLLFKKLGEKGVKDPKALARFIGGDKKKSAGKREELDGPDAQVAVSTYQKLSGLVLPMQGWGLAKVK